MDWRMHLQSSLRATEENLNRMQATSSAVTKQQHGGGHLGQTRHPPHNHFPPYVGATEHQRTHHYQGAPQGSSQQRSPHTRVRAGSTSPRVSVDPMYTHLLRTLGAEVALERETREGSMRELSRRSTNEVAELREHIRQLKEDNISIREAVHALELRRHPRNASYDLDIVPTEEHRGGTGTNIALLPRVADLEAVVERQQRLLEERSIRLEQSIAEAVKARVGMELEQLQTATRDAARESTEAFVKLRVDATQQYFETHLQSARDAYDKARSAASGVDYAMQALKQSVADKLDAIEDRVQGALEAKERWQDVSTEVHRMVRVQLEKEHVRLDETLRLLRSEVSATATRQAQETLDAQHALQHFVNQRLDAHSSQYMMKDDVQRLLSGATTRFEEESASVQRILKAYKAQFDAARGELSKTLQEAEGKWSDIRGSVDELSVVRHGDHQQLQRLRAAVDDMGVKVNAACERSEHASQKAADVAATVDTVRNANLDVQRDIKHTVSLVETSVEHLKKTSMEHASQISKANLHVQRLDQTAADLNEHVVQQRQDITAIQSHVRELSSTWKRDFAQHNSRVEAALAVSSSQMDAIASDATVLKEKVELAQKSVASVSASVREQIAQHGMDVVRDVTNSTRALEEQHAAVRASVVEQALRTFEQASRSETLEFQRRVQNELVEASQSRQQDLSREQVKALQRELTDQHQAAFEQWKSDIQQHVAASTNDICNRQAELIRNEVANVRNNSEKALEAVRCATEDCRVALDALQSSFSSKLLGVEASISSLRTSAAAGVGAQLAATRQGGGSDNALGNPAEIVALVEQSLLLKVDERLQEAGQLNAKRVSEIIRSTTDSVNMVRRLVNDLDERVTSNMVSSVAAGSRGTEATALSDHAAVRRWLSDMEQRIHDQVKRSVDAMHESLRGMELEQRTAETQLKQLSAQLSALSQHNEGIPVVEVPKSPHTATQSSQHADDVNALATRLEAHVVEAVRSAIDDLDVQTSASLEALDEKLNALAEAFSNCEDQREATLSSAVQQCLAALRDASGMMTNTQLHSRHSANDASVGFESGGVDDLTMLGEDHSLQHANVPSFLKLLTQRLIQCNDALHSISSSVLGTVDLVQRHETGFASLNELVQAIMFNSQNIVTLAEAVGLDKDAFALELNYKELGCGGEAAFVGQPTDDED